MVKFKEFFKENKYFTDYDGSTVAIDDCTTIDEKINKFLEENNIEYIDLKIFNSSHFLLIYKEKGDE